MKKLLLLVLFGDDNALNMDGEPNIHIGDGACDLSTGEQNGFGC